MKKDWLLPNVFKKIGWVLLIPTLVVGFYSAFNGLETDGLVRFIARAVERGGELPSQRLINGIEPWVNNLLIVGILVGSLFITCSRERVEDEMVSRMRLNSLLAALYINYAAMVVATLAIYGLSFLDVLLYNLFTLPLLFLVIYQIAKFRSIRAAGDEE